MGGSVITDTLIGTVVSIASLASLYVIRKVILSNYCNKCKMTSSCQSDAGIITIKIGPMTPQDIELQTGNKTIDGALEFIKKNSLNGKERGIMTRADSFISSHLENGTLSQEMLDKIGSIDHNSPTFRSKRVTLDIDNGIEDEYNIHRRSSLKILSSENSGSARRSGGHRRESTITKADYLNGVSRIEQITGRNINGDISITDTDENDDTYYIDGSLHTVYSRLSENRKNNSLTDNDYTPRLNSRIYDRDTDHITVPERYQIHRSVSDSHVKKQFKKINTDTPYHKNDSNIVCKKGPVRRSSQSPPQSVDMSSPPHSSHSNSPTLSEKRRRSSMRHNGR